MEESSFALERCGTTHSFGLSSHFLLLQRSWFPHLPLFAWAHFPLFYHRAMMIREEEVEKWVKVHKHIYIETHRERHTWVWESREGEWVKKSRPTRLLVKRPRHLTIIIINPLPSSSSIHNPLSESQSVSQSLFLSYMVKEFQMQLLLMRLAWWWKVRERERERERNKKTSSHLERDFLFLKFPHTTIIISILHQHLRSYFPSFSHRLICGSHMISLDASAAGRRLGISGIQNTGIIWFWPIAYYEPWSAGTPEEAFDHWTVFKVICDQQHSDCLERVNHSSNYFPHSIPWSNDKKVFFLFSSWGGKG